MFFEVVHWNSTDYNKELIIYKYEYKVPTLKDSKMYKILDNIFNAEIHINIIRFVWIWYVLKLYIYR